MANEELYCTCQQPADDRFMIACDKCEEWYHGECIGGWFTSIKINLTAVIQIFLL